MDDSAQFRTLVGGHSKEVVSLYTCSGQVNPASGAPDYRIITASHDNSVRMWDTYDMTVAQVGQGGAAGGGAVGA